MSGGNQHNAENIPDIEDPRPLSEIRQELEHLNEAAEILDFEADIYRESHHEDIDFEALDQFGFSALNIEARLRVYKECAVKPLDIHEEIWKALSPETSKLTGRETIVDLGTGSGLQLIRYRTEFGHQGPLMGINNSLYTFFAGQERIYKDNLAGIGLYTVDAHDLSAFLVDNAADRITANFLLYHVSHPEKVVSEGARVLKEDGYMVAAVRGVDNLGTLWSWVRELAKTKGQKEPESFYVRMEATRTRETLEASFEQVEEVFNQDDDLIVKRGHYETYFQAFAAHQLLFDPPPTIGEMREFFDQKFYRDIQEKGFVRDRVQQIVFRASRPFEKSPK